MNREKFYDAMENIDDKLVLGAFEEPKRKFHSVKKLRWTAAAACIAILLAVPVVAASLGLTVKHQKNGFWDVYNENVRFSLEEFSPEILSMAKETKIYNDLLFGEKISAEKFIGIEIPKNKALDPNNLTEIYDYDENGNPIQSGTYRVGFGTGLESDELIRVLVFTYYKTYGRYETVEYSYITEAMPYENAGFAWHDEDEFAEHSAPEDYIASDGRECIVVKQERKDLEEFYQNCGYIGMTIVDGVFIQAEVRCGSFDEAYSRVTEILDNF